MKKLVEQDMVDGLGCEITKKMSDSVCEPCAEGKQHHSKFPQREAKLTDTVLGLVHGDLCGKMSTQSLGGSLYFLTFINDKS